MGIQAVTVPLFIRDRVEVDERAVAIAAALAVQSLPGALLTLLGGSLADRVERRRILARTYAAVAVVACCYIALSGLDVREIWPVFPLAALVGSAGAFTNPARQAMMPELLTRKQLQNGVIFGTMGFMATLQFLGPTIGGLVTDLRGLTVAFALEALLLAAAAVLFGGVRTELPAKSSGSMFGGLMEGLRYVRGDHTLLALLFLGTVPGVFMIGPFAVTTPLIVPDIFHESDRWVGILSGCFGAGVVLGSIALTLRPLQHRGRAVCLATFTGGAVLVWYGTSQTLLLSAAILVVWGLSAAVFINCVVALLQEKTDPAMMGRVMSMYSLVFFASSPLGHLQAGLITTAYGIQETLVSSGIAAALIGLGCLLFLRPVRVLA